MRNTVCPLYELCLSEACQKRASGWDCDECPWRNSRGIPEALEVVGCYLLGIAVLYPGIYAAYLKRMPGKRSEIVSSIFTKPWLQDLSVINWYGEHE